jgi:hypothetical protein
MFSTLAYNLHRSTHSRVSSSFSLSFRFSAVGDDVDQIDPERQRLVQMYEEKIEELIKQHDGELGEEKRSNNNRVDALLSRLAECNSRYCDLMPDYEQVSDTSTSSSSSISLINFLDTLTHFKFFDY